MNPSLGIPGQVLVCMKGILRKGYTRIVKDSELCNVDGEVGLEAAMVLTTPQSRAQTQIQVVSPCLLSLLLPPSAPGRRIGQKRL